jgi:hypothetical protein
MDMKDVYKQCGMVIVTSERILLDKRKSDRTTMQYQYHTKCNSNGKENKAKKYMQHDLKLCSKKERQPRRSLHVVLSEEPEAKTTTIWNAMEQSKHCGRNDHQRKSNALC